MSRRYIQKKNNSKEKERQIDEQRIGILGNNIWSRIRYRPLSQHGYSTFQRLEIISESDSRIVDRYISESIYGTFESNKTPIKKFSGKAHLVSKKV